MLDDLQWADGASTSLLFHLGRRLAGRRILLVGAYRASELSSTPPTTGYGSAQTQRHPLEPVLNEFKRLFGDIEIDLGQIPPAECRAFVDALLDSEPNQLGKAFREALFRQAKGHPLFTVELLRDMQDRGDLVRDKEGRWIEEATLDWNALPVRVEAIIEQRLGRLDQELQEILTVGSVEGEIFTAQVVARLQNVSERQLLRQLSREVEQHHRLVRTRDEVAVGAQRLSRYQFGHVLFQQYLYNQLSPGERRLLHGEIAALLEELYQGHTDEITVQLARHYTEAEQAEKAVPYLSRAGDQARLAYAHEEAIEYYRRLLVFLKERRDYERAARTLMKLGLTYHSAFDFRQARQAYEEGFALWQRAGQIEPASLPPAPHALRYTIGGTDLWSLDPLVMAVNPDSSMIIRQLFSGLVEESPEMEVVPAVARSWEILAGGQTYIFHLRDGVRWSDGVPVTAEDFEYAWKRLLDPATGAVEASFLYDIKGARAFHQGEVSDPDRVGVRALDEATLLVELEEPTSYFLHLMAYEGTCPVPRHVVETHGEAWTEMGNIVTNGPFKLEAWQQGVSMILSRNPDYHGRFTGNVQRVELFFLSSEPSARLAMYEADGLDCLDLSSSLHLEKDRVRQRHAREYVSLPELNNFHLGFDVSRPPFDDRRVRRAFVLATDRETLADVVLNGYYFPATGGFVPPGMPGHSPGIALPYDPEQARRLLAEAGYPNGRGFPDVECLTIPGPSAETMNEYLQTQWHENLGIEIVKPTAPIDSWKMLYDRLDREPPHIFYIGWLADYADPDNFLRVGFPWKWTGWRHETYEKLVEEAGRLTDQAERMKLYGQADRILVEEAPIMTLAYRREHLLVKPWVRKYPASATRRVFWKDVIIEPD
jgi:oligopeptide transport system substrate-binding protein